MRGPLLSIEAAPARLRIAPIVRGSGGTATSADGPWQRTATTGAGVARSPCMAHVVECGNPSGGAHAPLRRRRHPSIAFDHPAAAVMRRALLIVDLQRGFLGPDTDWLAGAVAGYLERHHERYALVLATRFVNQPGSRYETERDWHAMMQPDETALVPAIAHLVEAVLVKDGLAPDRDELLGLLADAGIERVDLCGLDTDQCVLATALLLWDAEVVPRILSDLCTSSGGAELHDAARAMLRRSVGDRNVVRSDDLVPEVMPAS